MVQAVSATCQLVRIEVAFGVGTEHTSANSFFKEKQRGKKENSMRKVVILRVVVSVDRSLKWKVTERRRRLGRE
jgi:hypothetical protein